MKEYDFEYTKLKDILILQGLCYTVSILLFVGLIFTIDFIGVIPSLLLPIGVPVLIYFLLKGKVKQIGKARIFDTHADFELADSTSKVTYSDIIYYQFSWYNGAAIVMQLKDNQEFKLHANGYFCKADSFVTFCTELEKTIQQFKTTDNKKLTRKSSIFESTWMLIFLVVMTVGLIGALIFAISQEQTIPPTLYTTTAIMLPLWIAYITAKRKKKEDTN